MQCYCIAFSDLQTVDNLNSLLGNETMKENLGFVVRTKMRSETEKEEEADENDMLIARHIVDAQEGRGQF